MARKSKSVRFVASYAGYVHVARPEVVEHFGTGEKKVLERQLQAEFEHKLVDNDLYALALESFKLTGGHLSSATMMEIPPRYRLSGWDSARAQATNGWTDEELKVVLDSLRSSSENGSVYVELPFVPAEAPFPNYDEMSPEKVLEVVQLTGYDPEKVADYEAEHKNRQGLIEKLLKAEKPEPAVIVEA